MSRYFAAALCTVVAVGTTFAQPPGGGRGMFGRGGMGASFIQDLEMKEVQADLKLADADKEKIKALKESLTEGDRKFAEETRDLEREERMEKINARRADVEKQVKEALGDKFARFRQIRLQLDGMFGSVLRDREVREALNITEDQQRELGEAMRGAFQRPEPGAEQPSPEERRKMMEEAQKKQVEAAEKILTAEQKKKWEELIGEKVTYKRPQMPPPGGRRPRGEKKEEPKPPR
jgi:hypothetical protein